MGDFATPGTNSYGLPASPPNFISPQKTPLSSMAPTIILDENQNVQLAIGASGGSKIITSVALTISRYLYFKEPIGAAVQAPRVHHQLAPMRLEYESSLEEDEIEGLRNKGHIMYLSNGGSAVTAIARCGNQLIPVYDPRRGGSTEIID